MNQILLKALAGLIGLAIILALIWSMLQMQQHMQTMVVHIGTLSEDVGQMRRSVEGMSTQMQKMSTSMQNMEGHIAAIGTPLDQGSQQLQQWNPANMIR